MCCTTLLLNQATRFGVNLRLVISCLSLGFECKQQTQDNAPSMTLVPTMLPAVAATGRVTFVKNDLFSSRGRCLRVSADAMLTQHMVKWWWKAWSGSKEWSGLRHVDTIAECDHKAKEAAPGDMTRESLCVPKSRASPFVVSVSLLYMPVRIQNECTQAKFRHRFRAILFGFITWMAQWLHYTDTMAGCVLRRGTQEASASH